MAQIGMPQAQYNNASNQIAGTQAASLAAAQRTANPAAAIGNIVSGTNSATANLNAEDAQARQNNQRLFMSTNEQLGGQKLAQQQANVFDPYTQKYNEAAALKGAGMQNMNSAFSDIGQLGGLAMQYGLGGGNMPQTFQNPQEGQAPMRGMSAGVPNMQFQVNPMMQTSQVPRYTNWNS